MDVEFVNMYIAKLVDLVAEQTKSIVLKDAQISYLEKRVATLSGMLNQVVEEPVSAEEPSSNKAARSSSRR